MFPDPTQYQLCQEKLRCMQPTEHTITVVRLYVQIAVHADSLGPAIVYSLLLGLRANVSLSRV